MKRSSFAILSIVTLFLLLVVSPVSAHPLQQDQAPQPMTPEMLAAVVGTAISLIALLVPGVNTWFAGQPKETQQAIMAGLTLLSGVAIYILACTPALGFPFVACPTGGIWQLFATIIAAIVPNQSIYRAIPAPDAVKQAKAKRLVP